MRTLYFATALLTLGVIACSGGEEREPGAQEGAQTSGRSGGSIDPNRKLNEIPASELAEQCKANAGQTAQNSVENAPAYGPNALKGKCFSDGFVASLAETETQARVSACMKARDACVAQRQAPKPEEPSKPLDPAACESGAALLVAMMADCNASPNDFRGCQEERLSQLEEHYKSAPDPCASLADPNTPSTPLSSAAAIPLGSKCEHLSASCPSLGKLFVLGL